MRVAPVLEPREGLVREREPEPPHQPPEQAEHELLPLASAMGNAAFSRLARARADGPLIQRLVSTRTRGGDYISSENGKFAMPTAKGKDLFVTAAMLAEANQALSTAGGQGGAFVELVPNGYTVVGLPELIGVTIKARQGRQRPKDPYHRKVVDENQQVAAELCSHSDCQMSAQLVTGSDTGAVRKPVTQDEAGGRQVLEGTPDPNAVKLPGVTGAQALGNRLVYRLFLEVMPMFAAHLRKLVSEGLENEETGNPIGEKTKRRYRKLATDIDHAKDQPPPQNMQGFLDVYKHIEDSPTLNKAFSERFAVNEAITPRIGDALVYLSDPNEYQENKDLNKERLEAHKASHGGSEEGFVEDEKWNFHWAGVILTDGSDYVTFENLSLENEDLRNTEWFFQIHGPGKDSFHAKMAEESHATEHGITATVTSAAPPVEAAPAAAAQNVPLSGPELASVKAGDMTRFQATSRLRKLNQGMTMPRASEYLDELLRPA